MTTYALPERNDAYKDWAGCQARGYAPTDGSILVQGTRGRYPVLITCTARQIVAAQERARERAGNR